MVCSTVCRSLIIIFIPLWTEFSWVRMSSLVHVDCADIQHDTGTLGDKVAHVLVIFGGSVGDCSGDGCGHPSRRFFDHCADVWKLRFVSHGGKTARIDDAV